MSLLGIGLTGKSLTDLERKILRDREPCAVVLFGRNVGEAEQLRELVCEVKSLVRTPPLMMIDEEGGRVDRLRNLIPGLPSAEAFAEGESPAELALQCGEVIGAALRYFDIEIDLAPVVDVRRTVAPKGLERRMFGNDPDTVVELAGAFMRGLHSAGTASCLKHFPGLGSSSADSHYGATVIDVSLEELESCDLVPFAKLGREAGAILVGHGSYPRIEAPDLPATLSRRIGTDLLRNGTGFSGVVTTDDMEMHAVSDFGSYEDISERALMAGNDIIMFCSAIERIPAIDDHLRRRSREGAAFRAREEEAAQRVRSYRAHIEVLRRAAPVPASFDEVRDRAARFVEAFSKSRLRPEEDGEERRKEPRSKGTGRTGREEWT